MCSNICGQGVGSVGSNCESPLASWLGSWLSPEDERRESIMCLMLDYQIDCVNSVVEKLKEDERPDDLTLLLKHLKAVREVLGCPQG